MRELVSSSFPKEVSRLALIMAGGEGKRFWPLSRKSRPKQYLPLAGSSKSLIQLTAERVAPLVGGMSNVLVVTSRAQADLVKEHLPEARIISEPMAKNTAACLGFAARVIEELVGDIPIVCFPSDHIIHEEDAFRSILEEALQVAEQNEVLVTVGINPTHPETGYGYIQAGNPGPGRSRIVKSFVEKPSLERAEQFVASGEYSWNGGIFAWRPSVLRKAIAEFLPGHAEAFDAVAKSANPLETVAQLYLKLDGVSIDRGVLERAKNVVVMPGHGFRWSDVGSWDAWAESLRERLGVENVTHGEVIGIDSDRYAVVGHKKPVVLVGLSNVIVVDTEDAILVCHQDSSQKVREVVEMLEKQDRSDLI
ncbi:mannose-1-phosphate guanylyltransferase [bacterium]|nr:mannose-1-phosphate guanylyltransferase [bacterium]